jgi:hypothetical protein
MISPIPISIKDMVIADYQEFIAISSDIPEDLKSALKAHERVPAFFDALSYQLSLVEKNNPHLINRAVIKKATYDLADLFIKGVKHRADIKMMSDASRSVINSKVSEKQQLDNALDKEGNGEIMEGIYATEAKADPI